MSRFSNRRRYGTPASVPFGTLFPVVEDEWDLIRSSTLGTFERLLDEMSGNKQRLLDWSKNEIEYPKVNMGVRSEDEYLVVEYFVPGVKKSDLVIEYDQKDKTLYVAQNKKDAEPNTETSEDTEENVTIDVGNCDVNWLYRENRVHYFARKISLAKQPIEVTGEREIKTSLEDGILRIELPLRTDSIKQENRKLALEVK
jgi:HSP20 family molecular chaperone IbpA